MKFTLAVFFFPKHNILRKIKMILVGTWLGGGILIEKVRFSELTLKCIALITLILYIT